MHSTDRLSDDASPLAKHGLLDTWWDATVHPSDLAASVAKGEPRVAPGAYFGAAIVASCLIAAATNRLQLNYLLQTFGASAQLHFFERLRLFELGAALLLYLGAASVSALLFAAWSRRSLGEVLRMRAYGMGPIANLYAWWTMYRWLREVHPVARRPEAWALMSFTVEHGLAVVLVDTFAWPLRDLLLEMASRIPAI